MDNFKFYFKWIIAFLLFFCAPLLVMIMMLVLDAEFNLATILLPAAAVYMLILLIISMKRHLDYSRPSTSATTDSKQPPQNMAKVSHCTEKAVGERPEALAKQERTVKQTTNKSNTSTPKTKEDYVASIQKHIPSYSANTLRKTVEFCCNNMENMIKQIIVVPRSANLKLDIAAYMDSVFLVLASLYEDEAREEYADAVISALASYLGHDIKHSGNDSTAIIKDFSRIEKRRQIYFDVAWHDVKPKGIHADMNSLYKFASMDGTWQVMDGTWQVIEEIPLEQFNPGLMPLVFMDLLFCPEAEDNYARSAPLHYKMTRPGDLLRVDGGANHIFSIEATLYVACCMEAWNYLHEEGYFSNSVYEIPEISAFDALSHGKSDVQKLKEIFSNAFINMKDAVQSLSCCSGFPFPLEKEILSVLSLGIVFATLLHERNMGQAVTTNYLIMKEIFPEVSNDNLIGERLDFYFEFLRGKKARADFLTSEREEFDGIVGVILAFEDILFNPTLYNDYDNAHTKNISPSDADLFAEEFMNSVYAVFFDYLDSVTDLFEKTTIFADQPLDEFFGIND